MAGMYQAGIYKIDTKTKQVTAYPYPERMAQSDHAGLDAVGAA